MNGGHGTFVPGIHGLEHIHDLWSPHLSHDDAVRAHPEGVSHQVPLSYFAFTLNIGGSALHAADIPFLQLQFGCVLNGDDALMDIEEGREDVK